MERASDVPLRLATGVFARAADKWVVFPIADARNCPIFGSMKDGDPAEAP
jgi:hypothetical protein